MKKYLLITALFFSVTTLAQSNVDSMVSAATKYLEEKKVDSAINILITTINTASDKNSTQKALQLMSEAYQSKGDDAKALLFLNKMVKVKDSINTSSINALRATYEADKQAKELALQKAQIEKQKLVITAITLCSTLTIALLFALYKRKQSVLEAKMQTAILEHQNLATKAVLTAEEKERKRIAGDLHDGLGQMMSAVKMNLSSLASKLQLSNEQDAALLEKTLALVDESCKEVRSVSHNMMPNALLKSGLSSAVKIFLDKIDHKQLKVNLHTEGLENRLSDNIEITLYRVIQETVNNVIKHAHANQLDISLIKDIDGISCTIEDNGIGFNSASLSLIDGIGIKNIKARITYLQGSVEWDSFANKGTLVAVHVPL
jgi:two-component system NarL family sensor kinase